MREIASCHQEGAVAFLRREFRVIGIIVIPLAVLIFFTATLKVSRPNGTIALSFGGRRLPGAGASWLVRRCRG